MIILLLLYLVIVYISFIVVIIVKGDTKLGHQYRSHEVIMVYIAEDVMDYTGFTTNARYIDIRMWLRMIEKVLVLTYHLCKMQ